MVLRKKFYFIDYSEKIKLARRVHKILIGATVKGQNSLSIEELIRKLRWEAGIFNKKLRSKLSIDAKISLILRSIDILVQTKLLTLDLASKSNWDRKHLDYIFERSNEYKLTYNIHIKRIECHSSFDHVIKLSGFSPIHGVKQKLTKCMWEVFSSKLTIDYQTTLDDIRADYAMNYHQCMDKFSRIIQNNWISCYQETCKPSVKKNISIINKGDSKILFDCAYERIESLDILSDSFIEDRTIGTLGYSKKPTTSRKRNDYFMKYDESRNWSDKKTDRGHFLAHSAGGGINENIFPQKRDINRGYSKEGIKYRKIERYLSNNQGVFYFTRPIYFDFSIRPYLIEFGYITKDCKINVDVFENV